MATKGDIINGAYSRLRISGLTINATPEDIELALDVLDDMCAEFEVRNICLGYNFTNDLDPADESGVPREFIGSLKDVLSWRLAMHFGKQVPQTMEVLQRKAMSILSSGTAKVNRVQPSRRMPRGSGVTNRYNSWQRYSNPQAQAPISCSTNLITYGGILDFTESVVKFLGDETVSTFTLTPSNALTIVSSSELNGVVSYRVSCSENARDLETIELKVTTSTGRIQTFIINFKCTNDKVAVQ